MKIHGNVLLSILRLLQVHVFDITLQACNRFSYHVQGEGDNAFIDDISIINTTPVVAKPDARAGLSVYPNPSNGEFTLSVNNLSGNYDLKVISLLGNTVFHIQDISVNGSFTKKLNLSSLPAGIYFLSVNCEKQQLYQRIVIR